MKNEILKPTPPNESRKTISLPEKIARISIVPLTLITLASVDGCSKPPSSPQPTAGISGRSPQFPDTNSDRPLQNQPAKKDTIAPTPVQKKEAPTQAPAEKFLEQGWKTFRSLNYPYEIDYPTGFAIPVSNTAQGGKQDIFTVGDTLNNVPSRVTVSAEQIGNWVKLEDYTQNTLSQLEKTQNCKAFLIAEDIWNTQNIKINADIKPTPDAIFLKIVKTKVAGQKLYLLQTFFDSKSSYFPPLEAYTAIFTAKEQGWQVSLVMAGQGDWSKVAERGDKFQKMLASFKFIN